MDSNDMIPSRSSDNTKLLLSLIIVFTILYTCSSAPVNAPSDCSERQFYYPPTRENISCSTVCSRNRTKPEQIEFCNSVCAGYYRDCGDPYTTTSPTSNILVKNTASPPYPSSSPPPQSSSSLSRQISTISPHSAGARDGVLTTSSNPYSNSDLAVTAGIVAAVVTAVIAAVIFVAVGTIYCWHQRRYTCVCRRQPGKPAQETGVADVREFERSLVRNPVS